MSLQNKARAAEMMQYCVALLTAPSTSSSQNTTQPAVGCQAQQHPPSLALQLEPPLCPTVQLCDPCSSPPLHNFTAMNAAQAHSDIAGATAHSLRRVGSSRCLFDCMPGAGELQQQFQGKPSFVSIQKMRDLSEVVVELSSDTNEADELSEPDLMSVPQTVQMPSNTTLVQAACPEPSQMMLSLTHFFTAKHGMSWAMRRQY